MQPEYDPFGVLVFITFMVFLTVTITLTYRIIAREDKTAALLGTLSIIAVVLLGGILLTGYGLVTSDIVNPLINMASFVIGSLVGALSFTRSDNDNNGIKKIRTKKQQKDDSPSTEIEKK